MNWELVSAKRGADPAFAQPGNEGGGDEEHCRPIQCTFGT